nr:hypothetical protein [Tanacetum cinerariifolium]
VIIQNVQDRQNRGQRNYARRVAAAGNKGVQNRVGNANPNLALNVDNVYQANKCDDFDSDVDEAPTTQTMFMANLSSGDLIYDEAGPSYDSDILSEYVKDNAVQVVQSNVSLVPNDSLMMIINDMHEKVAKCVSANEQNKVVNESLTAKLARYKEHVEIYEKRASEMQVESSLYNGHEIVKTNHVPVVVHDSEDTLKLAKITRKRMRKKVISTICVEKKDTLEFDSFFVINKMKEQLQGKNNTIRKLKEQISYMNERRGEADRTLDFKALDSQNIELTKHVTALQEQNERFRAENEKVKQHYKELYDSIKIMCAKTIVKTTSLLTKNEKLKAQLKGKMKCVTMPVVKPKVLAPGMYAINVEPMPPRNRNNREVYLDYLKHRKESVETLREIVEEARIEKPLDNTLENACFYTK